MKIENQHCEVNINNDQTLKFKDKKVLLTLSKNNKLTWIKDWILFYYHNHDINAVLLYDNNSTEYQIDDIKEYLISNLMIDIEVYIVPWNFKYGPIGYDSEKNVELPWDSDFCQYGMFEHAKERFLSLATGVINADIDELLITPKNRSIFTYLDKYPAITYSGRWVEPIYNDEHHTHSSFLHYDINTPPCSKKWCINPQKTPIDAQWCVHELLMSKAKNIRNIYFAHFRAINWNNTRTQSITFNSNYHKVDKNLIKSLEKSYQKKIYVYNKLPDNFFKLCWDYIVK